MPHVRPPAFRVSHLRGLVQSVMCVRGDMDSISDGDLYLVTDGRSHGSDLSKHL